MSNNLLHTKLSKRKPLKHFPKKEDGHDGDMQIVSIKGKGTYLCLKDSGEWKISDKFNTKNKFDTHVFDQITTRKIKGPGGRALSIGSKQSSIPAIGVKPSAYTSTTNTIVKVGSGSSAGIISSLGDNILKLQTDSENTSSVSIHDAPNYDIISQLYGDGSFSITSEGTVTQTDFLIDKNFSGLSDSTNTAMHIDFDAIGIIASGQTSNNTGIDIDMNCQTVTHVGTITQTGIDIDLVAATDGAQSNYGMDINVSGGDHNFGLQITSPDTDIKLLHDSTNFCTIATSANGATEIATVDAGGDTDGNLTLDIDGDIILEAAGGNVTSDAPLEITSTSTQLKLTHNAADYATFTVADTGDLTIATVGDGVLDSDMTLDADGNITLDASYIINFTASAINFSIEANPSTNLPVFNIKSIADGLGSGFGPALKLINQYDTPAEDMHDGDVLGSIFFDGWDDGTPSEQTYGKINCVIEDASSGAEQGRIGLSVAANDGTVTSGLKLVGNASAAQVDATFTGDITMTSVANTNDYLNITVGAEGASTISTVDADTAAGHMTLDPDGDLIITTDPNTGQVTIDKDSTNTATATNTAMQIDFDHTGIAASGQTITNVGLDLDINCESVTHVGIIYQTGIDIDMVAATDGAQAQTGMDIKCTGGDKNHGLDITVPDGGSDYHIKLIASDNISEHSLIKLAETGDLTITTAGDGSTDSDLILDIDGDIELNAAGGDIVFKANLGTLASFSAGDSKINYNATNFLRTVVTSAGVVTLTTVGGTLTDADFILDAGGDITLNSGTGIFIAEKGGTEFSAANSAYAGMILAYTCLLNDVADDSYSVTDAYAVPDADMKIVFVAPPSGNVEIFSSIYAKSTATRQLFFGLSDNSTYSTIDVTHEHEVWIGDETDEDQLNHQWVITGLTAGTSYTYFLGAKSGQTGRITLHWGGDATGEYAPFIMKATALPATLYTG